MSLHTITLDLDGLIYLPDIPCRFEVEYDVLAIGGTYFNRGLELTGCRVTLADAQIGGLLAPRHVVRDIIGAEHLLRIERAVTDQLAEAWTPDLEDAA